MKKELDEALCRDFPKLFSDRNGSMMETCMYWGFEHGDGWEPIIRTAAAKLEALNDAMEDPSMYIKASQIKEKYGTLRFYLGSVPEALFYQANTITGDAEDASEVTCETCGAPGKMQGKGWYYTACEKHTK